MHYYQKKKSTTKHGGNVNATAYSSPQTRKYTLRKNGGRYRDV